MARLNNLTTLNAEASRRVNGGVSVPSVTLERFQNCSLPGLIEFFLSAEAARGATDDAGWGSHSSGHPLGRLWRYLLGTWSNDTRLPLDGGKSSARDMEFFLLDSWDMVRPDSENNLRLHEFEARLVKGGRLAGMPPKMSYGLASIVHELIENVFQHSDGDRREHFRGLVGYHSLPNYFSFSVGDLGIGTLNSLQLSSKWSYLGDDRDALDAIVSRHASRKANLDDGEGFKTVIKNLIDRNTFLQLRSGSSSVRLKGVDGGRVGEWYVVPALGGLHVSIVWTAEGTPEEKMILN